MICQNCIHFKVCKHKTESVYECEHFKEIITCKECKGCELSYPRKEIGKKAMPFLFCTLFERETKADGYCECGVRRDNK